MAIITRNQQIELANRKAIDSTPYSKRQLAAMEESTQKHHLNVSGSSKHYASCRVYPNGEFGVGRLPAPRKRVEDERYDHWDVQGYQMYEDGRPYELEDGTVLYDATDKIQVPSTKLGTASELSQPPRKYGVSGITGYGKRVVRNIAVHMEQRFGHDRLVMGTLTIPSLHEPCMLVICSNWAQLQKRFFEKCKRRYAKLKRPWMYVSVTEIQPRRWNSSRECGLHIHFIAPTYYVGLHGMYTLDYNWVREAWRSCISNLLARHFPDGFRDEMLAVPNFKAVPIDFSAAAYMGKYMSKGADICQEVASDLGEEWLPSQWWSASSNAKKWLKDNTIHTYGHTADMLMDMCIEEREEYLHYSSPVVIDTPSNDERIIGYAGRLNDYGYQFIQVAYLLSKTLQMEYG